MCALRKTQLQQHAPWQRVRVQNPCPTHPERAMELVILAGREVWKCSHPAHIIPARTRASARPDHWRVIPPPLYVLPDPQPTGVMQPVPRAQSVERETPEARPAWLVETHRLQPSTAPRWLTDESVSADRWLNVKPEDCEPVLEENDNEITVAHENKALYQLRLLVRRKESEQ